MSDDFFADPEICQAVLMDYYRNPRGAGICDPATHEGRAENPACGDFVKSSFAVSGGVIRRASFSGAGCAVSQAAASLLIERLEGKSLGEAWEILWAMKSLLEGGPAEPEILGRLEALRMITGNPARVRCAATARDAVLASGILDAGI